MTRQMGVLAGKHKRMGLAPLLFVPGISAGSAEQQQQEEFCTSCKAWMLVLEAYIDERVISLSGYSQVLGDMVIPEWVGNRQVNVQAAIRHQTDGKAVIMIGSPFILADY